MADQEQLLDTDAVADRVGVKASSIRIYLKRTRTRIADGLPVRPQDFPVPDQTIGRSPGWYAETIDQWLSNRPGPGRRRSEQG